MAPKTKVIKAGGPTHTERLNRFSHNPEADAKLLEAARTAFEKAHESYGFDHAATTTQNRRKLHLAQYEAFVTGSLKSQGTEPTEDLLWGKDSFHHNLRAYIFFCCSQLEPRSYSSESVKFQTIIQRRQSMVYWARRKCKDDVLLKAVWNDLNEAVYAAFRKYNISTAPSEKAYLTKFDLGNLLEYDMYHSVNTENSQQQQICWVLGFVCGVRPGTIGVSRKREGQFLTWGDIEITRLGPPASCNFQAKVTFKWLKGYRDETLRPLTFKCLGPGFAEDVLFSIPHRLLALALRRGLLRDYNNAEALFADDRQFIAFKESAKKLPVVCASSPKGSTIVSTQAATCDAISAYIQRQTINYGLPPGITHYAWRRSAGTRFARAQGTEKARVLMGHGRDTDTYEESYDEGTLAFDAFGVAMGRLMKDRDTVLADDLLSINRIHIDADARTRWIRQYINKNEQYIESNNALQAAELAMGEGLSDETEEHARQCRATLNKIRRTLQSQGRLAFQRTQIELQKESLTAKELEERRKDVIALGKLQKLLLENARDARLEAEARVLKRARDDPEELEADDELAEEDVQDSRDLDASHSEVEVQNLRTTRGEEEEGDSTDPGLPAACRLFMDVLEQNADQVKEAVPCRLCLEDPTVPEAEQPKGAHKSKTYMPGKLNQHLGTDFHTPKKRWLRKVDAATPGKSKKCPFPVNGKPCTRIGRPTDILQHVQQDAGQSDDHLLAAAKDGIFARDFDPRMSRSSTAKTKVVSGKASKVEDEDPDEVPASVLIHPRNLTAEGELDSSISTVGKDKSTIRLPTKEPLTETAFFKTHEEGIHGELPDVLQGQHNFIASFIDDGLRAFNKGQASESGETRVQKQKSDQRVTGIAKLRQRLTDLDFAWAGDEDNVVQPEDEDDGTVFGVSGEASDNEMETGE